MQMIKDAVAVAAAGYAGTQAMETVATKLMQIEPAEAREREQEVRPGPPFVLAADNLAERVVGVDLDQNQRMKAGMAFHYLAGLSWAAGYQVLRHRTELSPLTAGLITGASQTVLLDEIITPAVGASAPNREYPLATHLRGLAAHLAFGAVIAATTETIWKLLRRR